MCHTAAASRVGHPDGGVRSPIVVSEAAVRSRTFEAGKAIVFDSVVAVFEDLGYTILRANRNSGIVSAEGALEEPARSLSAEFLRKRQAVAGAPS